MNNRENFINFVTKVLQPYKDEIETEDIRAYYVSSSKEEFYELPIISINDSENLVTCETNHFTSFYAGKRFTHMNVNLVNNGGKIAARLNVYSYLFGGQLAGLDRALCIYWWHALGVQSLKDAIFWNDPSPVFAIYHAKLYAKKYGFWTDNFIDDELFIISREFNGNNENHGIKIYKGGFDPELIIFEDDVIEDDDFYERYFQGFPLVIEFDSHEPNSDYEYYLKIKWTFAQLPEAQAGSRFVAINEVNTYDYPQKFIDMYEYTGDQNDSYDISTGGNNPPDWPEFVNPEDEATNVPISTDISWTCTDPDNDLKDFDIHFGNVYPPPLVEEYYTNTTYDPGTLYENETYYWKIVAYDEEDNFKVGEDWSFTTGSLGGDCPPTINDIDGNTYNTVQVGTQCWMAENLKTTTYQDGTSIPNIEDNNAWSNLTTGAYAWYENDEILWKDSYGALYNWYTTVDAGGLCPTGWHVPAKNEWTTLTNFISGETSSKGNKLKSCRQVNSPEPEGCNTTEHPRWKEHNTHYGTDDYGFSGLPGGTRYLEGTFDYLGNRVYWWSSTPNSSQQAWDYRLRYSVGFISSSSLTKKQGFSIRCLKD